MSPVNTDIQQGRINERPEEVAPPRDDHAVTAFYTRLGAYHGLNTVDYPIGFSSNRPGHIGRSDINGQAL